LLVYCSTEKFRTTTKGNAPLSPCSYAPAAAAAAADPTLRPLVPLQIPVKRPQMRLRLPEHRSVDALTRPLNARSATTSAPPPGGTIQNMPAD